MANLEVKIGSLVMENPIMVGSATPTWDGAHSSRAVTLGAGASVLKTICPAGEDSYEHPQNGRFVVLKSGGKPIGMVNIEIFSTFKESQWLNGELQAARQDGAVIVASTVASEDPAVTAKLIRDVTATGLVDAVELNNSCPMHVSMRDWNIVSLTVEQVSAARKATDLPLLVKFPSTVTSLAEAVRAAECCGADGVVLCNSMSGFAGVDIETGVPRQGTIGGYSGAAIKPLIQAKVIEAARAVKIPIVAVGGISCWQDVVEYIMLGATAVEVVSAVMWQGYDVIRKMNEGIAAFMDRRGYGCLADMRGVALPYIGDYESVLHKGKLTPRFDPEKCTACGRCVKTCFYDALSKADGAMRVDPDRCDGCGLCTQLCPFGAVSLGM